LTLARQTSRTPTGAERAITITDPRDGDQISGSVQLAGSVTIAPFENNLVYTIIDASGNELASGSITVDAETLGGPGTFDQAIDLGAIPAGSIVRILVSDVSVADGSTLAMDSVEVFVK
jgi:riboflavin synthase alpha subunit